MASDSGSSSNYRSMFDEPVWPMVELLMPQPPAGDPARNAYQPGAVGAKLADNKELAAWAYTLSLWTRNAHQLFSVTGGSAWYPPKMNMQRYGEFPVDLPTYGLGGTEPNAIFRYKLVMYAGHHRHIDIYFAPTLNDDMAKAQASLAGITGLNLNGAIHAGAPSASALTRHYLWWHWAGILANTLSDSLFRLRWSDLFLNRINLIGLSAGGPLALFTRMQLSWMNRDYVRLVQLLSPPCVASPPWLDPARSWEVVAEAVTLSHHDDWVSNLNALPGLASPYTAAFSLLPPGDPLGSPKLVFTQTAEHPTAAGAHGLLTVLGEALWKCCGRGCQSSSDSNASSAAAPDWELFGSYLAQLYPPLTPLFHPPPQVHDAKMVADALWAIAKEHTKTIAGQQALAGLYDVLKPASRNSAAAGPYAATAASAQPHPPVTPRPQPQP